MDQREQIRIDWFPSKQGKHSLQIMNEGVFKKNLKGSLGMCYAPGIKKFGHEQPNRNVCSDIEAIVKAGCEVLVTLMEEREIEEFVGESIGDVAAKFDLKKYIHFPLPDMSYPSEEIQKGWLELVDELASYVQGGNKVVIHCKAGKGRTGMLVACVLITLGAERKKVVSLVRDIRPGTIQTWQQEKYVLNFEKK